jgi:hypothetical protein
MRLLLYKQNKYTLKQIQQVGLTLFLMALVVRTISTASPLYLTAALFLVLTIMSCTSLSCQAGACAYPHLLFVIY